MRRPKTPSYGGIKSYKIAKPKAYKPPPVRDYGAERLVEQAIHEKRVLLFRYKGDTRTFGPHVLWQTKSENVVVYGIQRSTSDSFGQNGEHTFTVSEMENLQITAERFTKDPSFDVSKARDGVIAIISGF